MKKNIYLVLFALLLGIGAVSCDNESEDLFEQTAAERKTEAIKEYEDALKSAENGWLFQYFADDNQKYGGYNYVVKFDANDVVSVWYEKFADQEAEVSSYDIISYGGPVLSFNTYNEFLHDFATPSSAEYNAKSGDFEFALKSNEGDIITLKGLKTQNDMRLIKLTETPQEYFAKCADVMNYITGATLGTTVNGTEVSIINGDRVLTFSYKSDEELINEEVAFIPTDKGIRLYEPVEVLGITVQNFTLDQENNLLTADNGNMTIEIAFAPINFVSTYWILNTLVEEDRSQAFIDVYDAVIAANDAKWGLGLSTDITLGKKLTSQGAGYTMLLGGQYYIHYNLSFDGIVGHQDYLGLTKLGEGVNWSFVPHVDPLVNLIVDNAPYKVEYNDPNNPTGYLLTSVANPEIWFVIK